jgi:hypothetical protein
VTIASLRLACRLTLFTQAVLLGFYRTGRGWIVAAPPLGLWFWARITTCSLHRALQAPRRPSRPCLEKEHG